MESKLLAEFIHSIEWFPGKVKNYREYRTTKEYYIPFDKSDSAYMMETSNDNRCWYLWKSTVDQPREFYKIVPRIDHVYSIEQLERIIESQSWICC